MPHPGLSRRDLMLSLGARWPERAGAAPAVFERRWGRAGLEFGTAFSAKLDAFADESAAPRSAISSRIGARARHSCAKLGVARDTLAPVLARPEHVPPQTPTPAFLRGACSAASAFACSVESCLRCWCLSAGVRLLRSHVSAVPDVVISDDGSGAPSRDVMVGASAGRRHW